MKSSSKRSLLLLGAFILAAQSSYSTVCSIDVPNDKILCDVTGRTSYGYSNAVSNKIDQGMKNIEYNIGAGGYLNLNHATLGNEDLPFVNNSLHKYMENVTIKGKDGYKASHPTGDQFLDKPLDFGTDVTTDEYAQYRKYVDRSFTTITGFLGNTFAIPTYDIGNLTLENTNLNVYAKLRFNSHFPQGHDFNITLSNASIQFMNAQPEFMGGKKFNIIAKGGKTAGVVDFANTFTILKAKNDAISNGAFLVDKDSVLRIYQTGDIGSTGSINGLHFRNFQGALIKEGGDLVIDRSNISLENSNYSKGEGLLSFEKDSSLRMIGSGTQLYAPNITGTNMKNIELQNSKLHVDNMLMLHSDTAKGDLNVSTIADQNTDYNLRADSNSSVFTGYLDMKNQRILLGYGASILPSTTYARGDNTIGYFKPTNDNNKHSITPALDTGLLRVYDGHTKFVNTLLNFEKYTSDGIVSIEKGAELSFDRTDEATLNEYPVTRYSTMAYLYGFGKLTNKGYSHLKILNNVNSLVSIVTEASPANSNPSSNEATGLVIFKKGLTLNDGVNSDIKNTLTNNGRVSIETGKLTGGGEVLGNGLTYLSSGVVVDPGYKYQDLKDKTDTIILNENTQFEKNASLHFDFVSDTDFDKIGYNQKLVSITDHNHQTGVAIPLDFKDNIKVSIATSKQLEGEYTVFAEKNAFPANNPAHSFAGDTDLTNITNQISSAYTHHFANEVKAVDKGGINNTDITLVFTKAPAAVIANKLGVSATTQNSQNVVKDLAANTITHGLGLTGQDAAKFMHTSHPELYGTNISVMQNSLDNFGQAVLRRSSHLNGLWGDSSFTNGKIDGKDGLMDIDFKLDDVVIGGDLRSTADTNTGWYLGYGHTSFTPVGINSKFKSDGINVGMYHDMKTDKYSLATQLGYSLAFNKSNREVAYGNDTIKLSDDFTTNSLSGRAKLMGTPMKTSWVEVKPNLSLAGMIITQGKVDETGHDITAYHVDRKVTPSLILGAGLEMNFLEINEKIGLRPNSYVKVQYDVLSKKVHEIKGNMINSGSTKHDFIGQSRGSASIVVGAGMATTKLPVNINFGINYEKDSNAHQFGMGAGFSYKF